MFSRSKKYLEAYENTDFTFKFRSRLKVIRVKSWSSSIDQVIIAHKSRAAAFITVYNPFSISRAKAINFRAHRKLEALLNGNRLLFIEGEGRDPSGEWEAEKSVVVFGISRTTAAALGRRFRQNAIVFVRAQRPSELILLQ
jgi:hypothetical protein